MPLKLCFVALRVSARPTLKEVKNLFTVWRTFKHFVNYGEQMLESALASYDHILFSSKSYAMARRVAPGKGSKQGSAPPQARAIERARKLNVGETLYGRALCTFELCLGRQHELAPRVLRGTRLPPRGPPLTGLLRLPFQGTPKRRWLRPKTRRKGSHCSQSPLRRWGARPQGKQPPLGAAPSSGRGRCSLERATVCHSRRQSRSPTPKPASTIPTIAR